MLFLVAVAVAVAVVVVVGVCGVVVDGVGVGVGSRKEKGCSFQQIVPRAPNRVWLCGWWEMGDGRWDEGEGAASRLRDDVAPNKSSLASSSSSKVFPKYPTVWLPQNQQHY